MLADDFITSDGSGITADLASAYDATDKTQLSVMEVNSLEISEYWVVVPYKTPSSVAALIEKPEADKAPSKLASIGRYVLTPDIFDILRNQQPVAGGEIQLADAINMQAANNAIEVVKLNGFRFDWGGVGGLFGCTNARSRTEKTLTCIQKDF